MLACSIKVNTALARLIAKAEVIVWDEAPMTHRHALEAVNRTLQDIMGATDPRLSEIPFGGKTFVLGGGFRQMLPVVRRGDKFAALKLLPWLSSEKFSALASCHIHTNMRVQQLSGVAQTHTALFCSGIPYQTLALSADIHPGA